LERGEKEGREREKRGEKKRFDFFALFLFVQAIAKKLFFFSASILLQIL